MSTKTQVKAINLKDRVEVVYTATNPYGKKGQKSMASPFVAEKGIKLGHYEPLKKAKD